MILIFHLKTSLHFFYQTTLQLLCVRYNTNFLISIPSQDIIKIICWPSLTSTMTVASTAWGILTYWQNYSLSGSTRFQSEWCLNVEEIILQKLKNEFNFISNQHASVMTLQKKKKNKSKETFWGVLLTHLFKKWTAELNYRHRWKLSQRTQIKSAMIHVIQVWHDQQ